MSQPARRRIVLAAEDNETHQLVLKRVLNTVAGEGGIELRFAGNGRELIDMLQAGERPDLVLLDLHMPMLDGVDTVAAIRRDPLLCTTPVVMLSSSSERRHVEAAYRNGANAYLLKSGQYPVLLEQMRHAVAFWLETALLPP